MFETEAEEYEDEHSVYDETFDMVLVNCSTKQTFQDAATFGYNKGKSEAREVIEGLMRFCRCFAQHHTEDIRYKDAEQFLKEVEG